MVDPDPAPMADSVHEQHDDAHGEEAALGPLDLEAWAFAVAGALVGLLVALALWVASQG